MGFTSTGALPDRLTTQTDRQSDRQTDGHADRQTDRRKDTHTKAKEEKAMRKTRRVITEKIWRWSPEMRAPEEEEVPNSNHNPHSSWVYTVYNQIVCREACFQSGN